MQGCSTVEFFVSFICVDELISLFSFSAISDKSDRNTKILKARLALHACEITSRLCSGSHTSIYTSKANFLLKALLGMDVGVYDIHLLLSDHFILITCGRRHNRMHVANRRPKTFVHILGGLGALWVHFGVFVCSFVILLAISSFTPQKKLGPEKNITDAWDFCEKTVS
jgi:hypothetical protein